VILVLGEDLSKGIMTPAQKDIFEIDRGSAKLSPSCADPFSCHGCKSAIHFQERATGYPAGHCFSLYLRVDEYQTGLVEAEETVVIFELSC